jgi:hypothetical protein
MMHINMIKNIYIRGGLFVCVLLGDMMCIANSVPTNEIYYTASCEDVVIKKLFDQLPEGWGVSRGDSIDHIVQYTLMSPIKIENGVCRFYKIRAWYDGSFDDFMKSLDDDVSRICCAAVVPRGGGVLKHDSEDFIMLSGVSLSLFKEIYIFMDELLEQIVEHGTDAPLLRRVRSDPGVGKVVEDFRSEGMKIWNVSLANGYEVYVESNGRTLNLYVDFEDGKLVLVGLCTTLE